MASNGVTELEAPSTDLITLTRHILSQQYALGETTTGDLTMLLVAIQVSGPSLSVPLSISMGQ
jgi:fructose-1,6-bisphosphatase I